ncbi:MAG: SDR family NAD(P)-dependent oxidoreductase [Turneriella sp.]|nr:SDR family NAD(P)-dependent oxidoreductase [Turneriella sp.]
MRTLENRVAVITGAGSGIGRALALLLARRGCHLALSDINSGTLHETAAQCRGVRVFAETLDVADRKAMESYPERVVRELGAVHIVINNAGVALAATVEETTIEDYEWLMGINWWGVLYGTKFFLPYLRQADEAHIVNISSVFGLIGVPTQSAYNAAKFAVRGFTECLRQELAGTHIGVTCVHPGGIRTNIAAAARYKVGPDGNRDHASAAEKFARIARTSPEQAAEAIVRGIEDNSPRVLIGPEAFAIDVIARALPEGYPTILKPLLQLL